MELIEGLVGWFIGLFLWSNVIGNLVATTPLLLELKKAGHIKKIKWAPVIGGILFAALIFTASAIWLRPFFIGSLVGGVMVLFRLGGLKHEAMENIQREYPELTKNNL